MSELSIEAQNAIKKWKHLVIWQILDKDNNWVDYPGDIGAHANSVYRIRPECCLPIKITTIVPYCDINKGIVGKYLWLADTKRKGDDYLELTLLLANKVMVDALEPGQKPMSFTMGF